MHVGTFNQSGMQGKLLTGKQQTNAKLATNLKLFYVRLNQPNQPLPDLKIQTNLSRERGSKAKLNGIIQKNFVKIMRVVKLI